MTNETFDKLEEWGKTRSLATAAEICEGLLADMQAKAIDDYAEPTIYEGEE